MGLLYDSLHQVRCNLRLLVCEAGDRERSHQKRADGLKFEKITLINEKASRLRWLLYGTEYLI